MEGTIKAFEKKLKDGQHETWTSSQGKTFYKFIITIGENRGDILSTSMEPKWKIDSIVTYEMKESQYGISFSKMKTKDNTFKPYNDPATVRKNAASMGMKISTMAFKEMKKHVISADKAKLIKMDNIKEYSTFFYVFIMDVKELTRDNTIYKFHALEHAINTIEFEGADIKTKEAILEAAIDYMNHTDKISSNGN